MLWAFRDRVNDLKNDKRLRYVLLFKNQGEAAGATLEHTHSQLIALPVVPKRVQEEVDGAKDYYDFKERCMFCDLIRQEAKSGDAGGDRDGPLHRAGAVRGAVSVRDVDPAEAAQIALMKTRIRGIWRIWRGF